MKKWISGFVFVLFLFQGAGVVLAAQPGTPEYEAIKAYKKQKREQKATSPATASAVSEFWKKEGERSGLSHTGSNLSTFVKSLNPAPFLKQKEEAYNARKGQVASK